MQDILSSFRSSVPLISQLTSSPPFSPAFEKDGEKPKIKNNERDKLDKGGKITTI